MAAQTGLLPTPPTPAQINPGLSLWLDEKRGSRQPPRRRRRTGHDRQRIAYRSRLFADALRQIGARNVRTRPYTPRTNGKAERFIQTSLREWAYARPYASSDERAAAIKPWIDDYNLSRPHSGIKGLTPWSRVNNLLGNDT
jgi:transposase InsO family protein